MRESHRTKAGTATLSILDGVQGGKQYFYHLVTDASIPLAAVLDNPSRENNYSPLWDAHVSMWTPAAIDKGKVHRIHSMDEQKSLISEGFLTSASINPPGPGNPYVGGLRPTQAIINCPVIAHPDLPPQ